jgi:hypothetical protein
MARRRGRKTLAGSDDYHVAQAERLINDAWVDLERMPPTCEGGIVLSSRARANAERAAVHLQAITDREVREQHTKLFGLAHRAADAATKTVTFFSHTCKAPHREAADRPLFSRRKRR